MVSTSASPRQPQRARPGYRFEDYLNAKDERSLLALKDIRDLNCYYAEDKRMAGQYESDWSTASSPYVEGRIHDADDALNAVEQFQFPAEVKREAERAARQLVEVFQDVTKLQRIDDLTSGRLDRRKLPQVARHTASGTYDENIIRPYRRTLPTPSKRATVAVLGSAGNVEMWRDEGYIPRVLILTLGIQWACEAANLPTWSLLVQEFNKAYLKHDQPYREAHLGVILSQPGAVTSPRTFAAALHRDLWRYGQMTLDASDFEGFARVRALAGRGVARSVGLSWPSHDGGDSVWWGRRVLEADLVIAIGNVSDRADADIQLESRFSITEAVSEIVKQARKLRE